MTEPRANLYSAHMGERMRGLVSSVMLENPVDLTHEIALARTQVVLAVEKYSAAMELKVPGQAGDELKAQASAELKRAIDHVQSLVVSAAGINKQSGVNPAVLSSLRDDISRVLSESGVTIPEVVSSKFNGLFDRIIENSPATEGAPVRIALDVSYAN